jgi:hypothetical protein
MLSFRTCNILHNRIKKPGHLRGRAVLLLPVMTVAVMMHHYMAFVVYFVMAHNLRAGNTVAK